MLLSKDVEVLRVEELTLPIPLAVLGAHPGLVAANKDWLAPHFLDTKTQTFPLVFQTWIVRLEGLIIVVDPCNGNGRNRPVMPHFNQLNTPYIERFEAAGVRRDEVDLVFCTHLHCDHCGWNTHLRDGRWTPTFPKARYVFVRRETERWDPRLAGHIPVDYNVGVFEESVQPIIDAGLADLVADNHQLAPGMYIQPAYGHTAGHSILRLAAGDDEIVFTGDAFHHPLQVLDPALHLGGCDDLPMAIATRERLRATIADRQALMLPAHFPIPYAGRVLRRGDEFAFFPHDSPIS